MFFFFHFLIFFLAEPHPLLIKTKKKRRIRDIAWCRNWYHFATCVFLDHGYLHFATWSRYSKKLFKMHKKHTIFPGSKPSTKNLNIINNAEL